ncbi:MAG: hypothetical protein IT427_10920 [Pirellulales bacterium]|nr:hypothetical protein [Pirellulales bacterium]
MGRPQTLTSSPIALDLTAALDHKRGTGRSDLLQLAPRLEAARKQLIDATADDCSHWLNWPRRLLEDHQAQRHRGLLSRWLTAAKHFRHSVDRAVILGSPASIAVLKAVFAACCHPYHNELSRGERGGRPRIYFASTHSGNDAIQGLLDLLPQGRRLHLNNESWGIVALDDGNESELLTAICKACWNVLLGTTAPGEEAERTMLIGPAGSPLVEFAEQANLPRLPHFSPLPFAGEGPGAIDELHADCSQNSFHPGILLAAAAMNIDVVQYLFGAVTVTDRFRASPVGDNLALDFAGYWHLLTERRGIRGWLVDCSTELKPLAQWWRGSDASRLRDPSLLIQWLLDSVRRDRLRIAIPAGEAPSGRKKTLDRNLPDVSWATAESVRGQRAASGLPTAIVRLPTVNEATVGQLLQMRLIADHCALDAPP